MRRHAVLSCLFAACAVAATVIASPPAGITPKVLSRGTYPPFNVKTAESSPVKFEANSRSAFDVVVREHSYTPRATTGWHTHPGPVYITVVEGTLTFYEYGDPACTPKVVSAGQGYVDDGHGHIGVNETDQPARDVSIILAPIGAAFREELPAPGPHCKF